MSREIEQLEYIIGGGELRRWHTVPVLRDQRVDSHSYNVAWLCYILSGGNVRPHLLLAAMAHDLPEHVCGGDIPSNAKRELGAEFNEAWEKREIESLRSVELDYVSFLTIEENRILKLADVFEYGLYVLRERQMGNQLFGTIFERITRYLHEVVAISNQREVMLVTWLNDMWEQADGK